MFDLFKKPEYRKFNITPRYWDPKKEEREARERRVKAELGIKEDEDQYIPNIQGQFRRDLSQRTAARNSIGASRTLRLFMILVLLFLGAFYVFIKNPEGLLRLFGL